VEIEVEGKKPSYFAGMLKKRIKAKQISAPRFFYPCSRAGNTPH